MRRYYPHDQHPSWCDLHPCCDGEEPNHIGRMSRIFVQGAEARLTFELSRIDDTAPIGNVEGTVQIRLGLVEGATVGSARAELSVDEARAASLLLAQYVEYAEQEQRGSIHMERDYVATEGSM